ncbi:MAG: hypothetical protein WBL68_01405 [Nitrososphaeraceae archaeon]
MKTPIALTAVMVFPITNEVYPLGLMVNLGLYSDHDVPLSSL